MLANLVMKHFDAIATAIACDRKLIYSRYADDLIFSTDDPDFKINDARTLVSMIKAELKKHGFQPHHTKTKIRHPGSRRIVLGLLVDGYEPRLTKSFRKNLDQHLHFMTKKGFGLIVHAKHNKFRSVYGLKNHVEGLIAHAAQVDPNYANNAWVKFNAIIWP